MPQCEWPTVAYVVKRYPRYSETFIVTEILAHEAAGAHIEIFALRPPSDTHFQDAIGRVRAPVTYIPFERVRTDDFWTTLRQASPLLPRLWDVLSEIDDEDARTVYQAIVVAQLAVQRGISHLHAHFATSATSVARLAARLADLTYSFTAHAKDIYGPDVRDDDLRNKLVDASAVVTVSDYNLAHLRQTFGSAADRVSRVYNGLALEEFPYSSPHDRPDLILFVGRLVEKKGLVDLIDACAILDHAGCSFSCHIIGEGPLEASLREQIDRLKLSSRVLLLGPRPRIEVVRHLQKACVFAAPCVVSPDGDRDGLPTVLIEAMAVGTPCVATDVTGIPELISHELTGLIVEQHKPYALAAALDRLLTDTSLRVKLATSGRALVERSFDARRNAEEIRRFFNLPDVAAAPVPEEVG